MRENVCKQQSKKKIEWKDCYVIFSMYVMCVLHQVVICCPFCIERNSFFSLHMKLCMERVWVRMHLKVLLNNMQCAHYIIFMSYDTYARTLKFVLFNFFFRLSLKDIVYIGLRSIDPLEKLIMSKFNVNAYGMEVSCTHL